jgi:hypothetical protein
MECLVEGFSSARLAVSARFLHAIERTVGKLAVPLNMLPPPHRPDYFHVVSRLVVDGTTFRGRIEATERVLTLPALTLEELLAEGRRLPFQFPAACVVEALRGPDARIVGVLVRRQEAICGLLEVNAVPVDLALTRITVRLLNTTPAPETDVADEEDRALRTLACAHQVLSVEGARFLSMVEPPESRADAVAECRNVGLYPVLVGDPHAAAHDTLLASAVFVEDFPTLASAEVAAPAELEEALT